MASLGDGGAHRGLDAYSLHTQLEHRALTLVLGDYRVARGSGLDPLARSFPAELPLTDPTPGYGSASCAEYD